MFGASKMPSGILGYMTRHKTAANLLLVLMLIAGVVTFPKMRSQFFPDVIINDVMVQVRWDGAGPEDVDRAIVQVVEPALLSVEGAISTSAQSTEGSASVFMEFEPGWNISRAADDVQAAVDGVANQFPADAEKPNVQRLTWRDRVTDVVISGPVGLDQLGLFTDEFVARLYTRGVTRSTIRGVASKSLIIEVPSLSLIKHDVTMAQIAEAIKMEATTDPAGDVAGSARVRTGVAKRNAVDIENIVLRTNANGSNLTIGDVGRVIEQGIDRNRAYFVGSSSAISVRVDRSDKGDAIDIQASVQQVADVMLETLPPNVSIDLIRTRSEAISDRLAMLLDNGLKGLGLVLMLLFLFLNVRTAFWVAMGIPAAMAAALAIMHYGGLTLNMISLFALIITLGIVVDDAIVIGEHADYRARTLKEAPFTAAENAAKRMFLPVFSATLTTIIAFWGLTIVGGRFGNLINDIPYTVIAVLIASLMECFLILPNHMAHSITQGGKIKWYDVPSTLVNRGLDLFKKWAFRPFIAWVIWARYPVLAVVILALASQIAIFARGDVQWRFFNAPERGSVTGNFAMTPSASRADTLEQMRAMQEAVEKVGKDYEEKHGKNPVAFAMAGIGGNSGRGLAGAESKDPDQLGSIAIELIDADMRPYSSFAFVTDLQDAVQRHPRAETVSFRGWRSGPGGDALDVQLSGADARSLKSASESLQTALSKYPEVSALQDDLAYDKEELILELTPQGQALGLTIDSLGRTLRNRLSGIEAASFPDGIRSATIRVEIPTGELTADFVNRMLIRTAKGDYVPLADIVTVESRAGFSTIRRENGIQVISVTGDISEDDPARAAQISKDLENTILPQIAEEHGVTFDLFGLSEQEDAFIRDAQVGLILVLAGIFITLAWMFSSWTRPIVIMAIIPFGLVGTIYGHWWYGVPLSMFSIVGLIGMIGIIINDSIVLITTIDQYARKRGLIPAIIDGVTDRLRPVMLTTLTTVLGLAPLLYERSSQAQFLKPTVITLVYGLAFGAVLVLILVPSLLAMQRDFAVQFIALRRAISNVHRGRGLSLPMAAAIALLIAAFIPTIGWMLAYGQMPAFMGMIGIAGGSMGMALALFIALAMAVTIFTYIISAIFYGIKFQLFSME